MYVAASTSTSGMGWVGKDRHPTTTTTVSPDCRKRDKERQREGETEREGKREKEVSDEGRRWCG